MYGWGLDTLRNLSNFVGEQVVNVGILAYHLILTTLTVRGTVDTQGTGWSQRSGRLHGRGDLYSESERMSRLVF